jgi:Rrf2 family protein
MRLSTRTRYGTRLLFELAYNYGKKPVILGEIARKQNISEKYLSKIVIQLKSAGLVKSERGAKGGYYLSRPPSQINMKDVIEVLEGDLLLDCIKGKSICEMNNICPTYELWNELMNIINNYLSSFSLQNLVDEYKSKNEKYDFAYYI